MSERKETVEEKLERLTARDAAEAANEVPVVFSRELAENVVQVLSADIAEMEAFGQPDENGDITTFVIPAGWYKWIATKRMARDLITDAMRAKGML